MTPPPSRLVEKTTFLYFAKAVDNKCKQIGIPVLDRKEIESLRVHNFLENYENMSDDYVQSVIGVIPLILTEENAQEYLKAKLRHAVKIVSTLTLFPDLFLAPSLPFPFSTVQFLFGQSKSFEVGRNGFSPIVQSILLALSLPSTRTSIWPHLWRHKPRRRIEFDPSLQHTDS
jgi:hypothetical protein